MHSNGRCPAMEALHLSASATFMLHATGTAVTRKSCWYTSHSYSFETFSALHCYTEHFSTEHFSLVKLGLLPSCIVY